MNELKYEVNGMTCGHCVNSVTNEVNKVEGVNQVDVDLASNTVVVKGSNLNDSDVRDAIVEAGYEVKNLA